MASYATYLYYTGTFLGSAIASANFARLALRASEKIDQLTFNRAAAIVTGGTDTATITKIQNATCAIAEEIQTQESAGNADGITSERVGNYSVTYGNNSKSAQTGDTKISNVARVYLGSTALMFRGFADDEYGGDVGDDEN